MSDIKCRVCLATSDVKMYHPLSGSFAEFMNSDLSVLEILETVTSTNIVIKPEFPSQICTACLKSLRDCWNFVREFKDSQILLAFQLNKDFIKDDEIIVKVEPILQDFDYEAMQGDINVVSPKKKPQQKSGGKIVKNKPKKTPKVEENKVEKENNENVIIMSIEDVLREENQRKSLKKNSKPQESPLNDSNSMDQDDSDFTEQILICTEEEDDTEANQNILVLANSEDNFSFKEEEDDEKDYPEIITTIDMEKDICVMSIDPSKKATKTTRRNPTKPLMPASDKIKGMVLKRKATKKSMMIPCKDCHKTFQTARKLSAHRFQMHNPNWKEKFFCKICGYQSKTASGFTHHQRKHKGKQQSCDQCDKIYLTTTQLKEHKRRVHEKIFKNYLCNFCGRVFKFTTALNYHLSSVHKQEERQFVCRFCGGRYHTMSSLSRHERCHTGERPYKCKYCEKTFKGTPELRTHELRHEGRTIYSCQYCDKGFYQTWNMKIHMLQHEGSFKCAICKRGFIDAAVLNFHMATRHKEDTEKDKNADTSDEDDYKEFVNYYEDEDDEVILTESLLDD